MIINSALFVISALLLAVSQVMSYEPPLPYYGPPSSDQSRYSTNLAQQLYGGDKEKLQSHLLKSFNRLDDNGDGLLSVEEIVDAINGTSNSSGDEQAGPTEQMQLVIENLKKADGNQDGNITVNEIVTVYEAAFYKNFTLDPAICMDAKDRLALCQIDMSQNITDQTSVAGNSPVIAASAFFAREQLKCKTGLSGFQDEFAFQRCIIGQPCNRIISECFGRNFIPDSYTSEIAQMSAQNIVLDKSIKDLTRMPWSDPTFQKFIDADSDGTAGDIISSTAEVGFWSALLMVMGKLVLDIVSKQMLPLIEQGISAAVASFLTWITAVAPQVWVILGGLIATAVLGWYAVRNIISLIVSLGKSKRDLIMQSWDPYNGDLAPKCEWAVYSEQKCWSNGEFKIQSESICDQGGELYRDRECTLQNLRQFYQSNCIKGCRHMCLKADFDCGNDGYIYRNATQFVYVDPKPSVNQYMFNPAFAGKQYVLLDSRYVYRMTECRDTCNVFDQNLSGGGITACRGFVLQAPDPLLDPRAEYAKRQVCHMIAESWDRNNVQSNAEEEVYNNAVVAKEQQPRKYPVFLNSINELFQYDAMKNNQYPPMVVAMQE